MSPIAAIAAFAEARPEDPQHIKYMPGGAAIAEHVIRRSDNGTQPEQHCFTNAGGTEVCFQATFDNHNVTSVFDKDGVKDEHTEYQDKHTDGIAGNIPTTNVTAAFEHRPEGMPDRKLPPGSTIFQGHGFDNNEGFRDTHTEDGRNGTGPVYDDHKEDSDHDGHNYEAHGASPDGTLTNSEGHQLEDSKNLVDVHDANGQTDTAHVSSHDSDYLGLFHEHHAGDAEKANDSSLNTHANTDEDHVQTEHKGKDFLDEYEENSSKGSVYFHLNGNNAWKEAKQGSTNLPKELTMPKELKWPKEMAGQKLSGRSLIIDPIAQNTEQAPTRTIRPIVASALHANMNYVDVRANQAYRALNGTGLLPDVHGGMVELPHWLAVISLALTLVVFSGVVLMLAGKAIRAVSRSCRSCQDDEELAVPEDMMVEVFEYRDFPKSDM